MARLRGGGREQQVMRRFGQFIAVAIIAGAAGCQTVESWTQTVLQPPPTAPPAVQAASEDDQNPVYLPLGPLSYGPVFEAILQVLHDYGFEIAEANRYDGRVETLPRVSPGLGLFLKPGSPSLYDRLLATTQTYRHRVTVIVNPATNDGYFVEVIARKELEDLARPVRATVGSANFRSNPTVERQFEVIDATFFEAGWIFRGRDVPLEQELIRRLKQAL